MEKPFDGEGATMLFYRGKIANTPMAKHWTRGAALVGGPEPELRRWGSGEGGTTVNMAGMRSSDPPKERLQSKTTGRRGAST